MSYRRAAVEVKNKKGNSPLWLAANGGHLAVVEMLYTAGADIDSQDNRKVTEINWMLFENRLYCYDGIERIMCDVKREARIKNRIVNVRAFSEELFTDTDKGICSNNNSFLTRNQ